MGQGAIGRPDASARKRRSLGDEASGNCACLKKKQQSLDQSARIYNRAPLPRCQSISSRIKADKVSQRPAIITIWTPESQLSPMQVQFRALHPITLSNQEIVSSKKPESFYGPGHASCRKTFTSRFALPAESGTLLARGFSSSSYVSPRPGNLPGSG